MKRHKENIRRHLSAFMLIVFAIALTPWSVLHHHEPVIVVVEKDCKHISHVTSHGETCLVCQASFEKNYVQTHNIYTVYLCAKIVNATEPVLKSSYIELLSTNLRGPPLA